jgi:hypothetical protein
LQPALESARAEGAARRTAAFLDDARRRAVFGRRELEVRCNPRAGRLELLGETAEAKEFPIPEQVSLVTCRPQRVRYFPQGSSTGMTLLLRDLRGRERQLTVGAFTGLASVDFPP